MEPLKWRPAFEIGLAEIDNDHKELFALAEAIPDAIPKYDGGPVADFIRAARSHFHREEKILERTRYPGLDLHKKYHKNLLVRARRLKKL